MDAWKEGDNKYRVNYIEISWCQFLVNLRATVQRLYQPHQAGTKDHDYYNVTPSSLARLMRVMQGLPIFQVEKQIPSVKVRHPLDGNIPIYQGFGGKDGKLVRGEHVGLDYIVPVGTPIYAMMDGVVTEAPQDSGTYGRYAMVLHDDGYASLYAHLSKLNVKVGDVVKCGDVIGLSGGAVGSDGAGASKGYHLHVEVRVKGHLQDNTYNIDPIEYIKSYM